MNVGPACSRRTYERRPCPSHIHKSRYPAVSQIATQCRTTLQTLDSNCSSGPAFDIHKVRLAYDRRRRQPTALNARHINAGHLLLLYCIILNVAARRTSVRPISWKAGCVEFLRRRQQKGSDLEKTSLSNRLWHSIYIRRDDAALLC